MEVWMFPFLLDGHDRITSYSILLYVVQKHTGMWNHGTDYYSHLHRLRARATGCGARQGSSSCVHLGDHHHPGVEKRRHCFTVHEAWLTSIAKSDLQSPSALSALRASTVYYSWVKSTGWNDLCSGISSASRPMKIVANWTFLES
jgi:hypothetical protein